MQAHLPSPSSVLAREKVQARRRTTRPVTAQLLDELSRFLSKEEPERQSFLPGRSNEKSPMMDFALRVLQIPMSELTAASDMPCDKATIRVAIAVCEVLADVKPGFRHVKQHFEAYENTTGRAQAELAYTLFCCELGDPSFRSSIRPAAILNAFDVSRILSEVPSPGAEDPSPGEASEAIRVMEEMVGRFGMIEDVRVWKRDLVREFGVAVGLLQDGKVALQDTQARLKRFHQSSTDVDDGVQNIQQGCENLISIQGQLKSTLDSL